MRLPNWFTGRLANQPPAPARFAVDRLSLFDDAKTRALVELLALPRGRRDGAWTEQFFDTAWNAALVVANPAVVTGPDGFPYVRLNLPSSTRFKPTAIANLAGLCLERATGIALFADASDPVDASQYMFPAGMLDSLLRYDTWLGDPLDHHATAPLPEDHSIERAWGRSTTLIEAREVTTGSPSVQYLPTYTARALLNHLRGAWQIADPRVRLMVDPSHYPARTLVVGRKRAEFSVDAAWDVQCNRLLWYMPKGRSIAVMPDDWQLEDMTPLEQLAGQVPAPVR